MTDPGSSSTAQETVRRNSTPKIRQIDQPSLAPPIDLEQSNSSPLPSYPSSRKGSINSVSSKSQQQQMLASHPSALPHFYGSEASNSGDEDREEQRSRDEDRVTYLMEKKKREEARMRRRSRQLSATSSIINGRDGVTRSLPGSPAKRRNGEFNFEGHDGEPAEQHSRMPMVYGREGLGFDVGMSGTDYQVIVDEAAFAARSGRRQSTTYTSSLGSAAPSPHQTSAPFPSRSRQRSRQQSEASLLSQDPGRTPRMEGEEASSIPGSPANRVRFDGAVREVAPRERRSRPRPVSTIIQLEDDHIVFPDTLPPAPPTPQHKSAPSPTTTSFFHPIRKAPSITSIERPPSLSSSHHGIGGYARSTNSKASQSSLQLVLDDPIPTSPHFVSPSSRSTRRRAPTAPSIIVDDASIHSTEMSVHSGESRIVPTGRSARSARRPMGPTTIVGDILAQRDPTQLYFPSPPKSSRSTTSSQPSPPLSIISSIFPSRPRQNPYNGGGGPASPASSSSSRMPFPSAPSSARTQQGSFFPGPPVPSSPPIPSSPPRAHGRSRYAPRPPPSPNSTLPPSTSFASTLSTISAHSVEQPVFPALGAQLAPNGLVRSGIAPRRVSGTPWDKSEEIVQNGDELDRMMAAQRRTASDEEGEAQDLKVKEREKERKRKNVYNELMRTKTSDSIATKGADQELDPFQRELLARDTVKRSLGPTLMSEGPSRPASVYSGDEDAESIGLTPSTSASSDISTLPSFPDVPSHAYSLPNSNSYQSDSLADQDQVEVVLSSASSAASPVTPTFSYSYHPATTTPLKQSHRVSLTSTVSDQSHYEDASEELSRQSMDGGGPMVATTGPTVDASKEQTSLWVMGTLASTTVVESPPRPLSDIGEIEEPDEVGKPTTAQAPPVASTSSQPVVPPSPSLSIHPHPTMNLIQRSASPTFSQGSRSTASSAPVSYTAPSKAIPPMKTKSKFGKRIGAFFGGQPSYNAAALGLRGSGISSRDVARLNRPNESGQEQQHQILFSPASKPSSDSSTRPSSESHTRSHSHSSSSYSTFPPIPTTPSSFTAATFANPEFRVTPPSVGIPSVSSGQISVNSTPDGADKLADLLNKFEAEEKARFKGIATSRLGKTSDVVVV